MKATDALLADHKMIRKLLTEIDFDNPRFLPVFKTFKRVVQGHAWFEDEIFLPAVTMDSRLQKAFSNEIIQEHKDIVFFLSVLENANPKNFHEHTHNLLQFKSILDTHFKKEENALFPLAEQILDAEGLNKLGEEMRKRQMESIGEMSPKK